MERYRWWWYDESSWYILKLTQTIKTIDANIADGTGDRLNENLLVKIERKDVKDPDEFSGRFFVKVISDQTIQEQGGAS